MDRDRVLYCGAFARLAETTQVVSPARGYVFHNRLTHSLKVAQVARRMAEKLAAEYGERDPSLARQLDADATEAAALAHDLGHPPFGHIAEYELNCVAQAAGLTDGFEGNAQSFRIVCHLAASDAWDAETKQGLRGLNWTKLALEGLIKYPWAHGENPEKPKKWGYYSTEKKAFDWVRGGRKGFQRSLVAEVMDWADDITYALHDLQDFFAAGLVPVDRVADTSSAEHARFWQGVRRRKASEWGATLPQYQDALTRLMDICPFEERYLDTQDHRERLYAFSTGLITRYIRAIQLRKSKKGDWLVRIGDDERREIEVLKQFIWQYVILNPDLAVPQTGQRRAIRAVFRHYLRSARAERDEMFPAGQHQGLEDALREGSVVRFACDFVAGMTEHDVLDHYQRLFGHSSRS